MTTARMLLVGLLGSLGLFSLSTAARAEEPTRQSISEQQIQLLRKDIRDHRRQIVAANLPLTTDESARFWPVYDQYIGEMIKINDGRYALIKEYVTNYSAMTEDQASNYITRLHDADKAMIDLRTKYTPNFEKVLSRKKTAMFLQLDRRVQLMVELQLASQIPLINPK